MAALPRRHGGRSLRHVCRCRRTIIAEVIAGHHLAQGLRLIDDRLACRGRLLDQGGVLLRDLIHLIHGLADLLDPGGLLAGCGSDLGHDIGDLLHGTDDLVEGFAGFIDQLAALLHFATLS